MQNRLFPTPATGLIHSLTVWGATAQESPPLASSTNSPVQTWNWHVQNTDIVQGYPGFPANYSGPNSLPPGGEARESVSLDLLAGVNLWRGAEAHIDGMLWQGFDVNNTLDVEGFPNGEAFRLGTSVPNGAITRLFIRQTIGLGGEQEDVPDKHVRPRRRAQRHLPSASEICGGRRHRHPGGRRQFELWLGENSGNLLRFQNLESRPHTLDYQFISDPAFNQDCGPVSVFSGRLHWEFQQMNRTL
jgi:hypothetical protein